MRKTKELERFAERNFSRQRYAEAKKNLNDLITMKPYEPGYHLALGVVFRKEGRYEDAMKKYQDVLDLGGPKAIVHLLIGEALVEKGDKAKVFEHLKEAAVAGRNIIHDVSRLSLLQEFKDDTEFIKLALSLERYELQSKKSQDPMTNPPEGIGAADPRVGGKTGIDEGIPLTAEEQQRLLNDARKAYDRVLWYIKLEDEQKAMENYLILRAFIDRKDSLTVPKITNDFRELVRRMESLEEQIANIRLRFYYNQALGQLKKMKEHFQENEYQQVKLVFEEIKKLAVEMERTNPRFKPVASRVLEAGQAWITRTEIREEFDQKKPSIQGIIISPSEKKAIINNRIFNQGEEFDSFLVQRVENNRVTFRYKGEEIPLVFRRY
jgi:tetratricopeptide (TPR) repeat protein